MADRIAFDHPTVRTVPATVERVGPTRRSSIHVSEHLDVEDGSVIRLVLSGSEYRAQVSVRADGTTELRGAFDTPRMARNPTDDENRLLEWIDERDLAFGRTVHLDVVETGYKYGLRAPGEEATYTTGRPDDGLAAIAEDLEADR